MNENKAAVTHLLIPIDVVNMLLAYLTKQQYDLAVMINALKDAGEKSFTEQQAKVLTDRAVASSCRAESVDQSV